MKTATAAFISAVTRNSCGIDSPAANSPMATPAEATMNTALRMLLAAMIRERYAGSERSWISAYSGTM